MTTLALRYRIADTLAADPALLALRTRRLLPDTVARFRCRRSTAAEAIAIARRWVARGRG